MRCLSPAEASAIFGPSGFTVMSDDGYRSALALEPKLASRQVRVAAEQPEDFGRVAAFVRAVNRWLPSHRPRLLWVDHWDTGQFGGFETAMVSAAWRGLGEQRSLVEAPGLYLGGQDWDEQDQTQVTAAQAESLGLLVGVVAMMMITGSDGWLISEGGVDRVEFWEGNFFFHSGDAGQIARANEIVDEFRCVRWKS